MSVTPSDDLAPILTDIADQTYTQGALVDFTRPAATGGDEGSSHPAYTYSLTPDASGIGLTFNSADHYLSGTPTSPSAKVTYTATETGDSDGANESGSKTFSIGIQPKQPENFTATGGNAQATLSWDPIAGVSGWEYQQGSGTWTAIPGSADATTSHAVTGLTNWQWYHFKVRAFAGSGGARLDGIESDTIVATPNKPPRFNGFIADQVYTQGIRAIVLFPRATPDNPNADWRALRYRMSPDASPSGFNQTNPVNFWLGTPPAHLAKTDYKYTVREHNGGSASLTFTVSVKPKRPEGFSATAGTKKATLRWTAIEGISGWQYQKQEAIFPPGQWTAISSSTDATTNYTVTGLSAGKTYTFKVRAFFVGAGGARVDGVESGGASITTPQ